MNTYRIDRQQLNELFERFSTSGFIPDDPISIPHRFSRKEDIEIAGFFAAILAWGNRKSIINSAQRILQYMDDAPFDFISNHHPQDLKPLLNFKHRTFNGDDLLGFIACLKEIYRTKGLEGLFAGAYHEKNLAQFYERFFCVDVLPRTGKHIARIDRGSAAKRLNMYLRWMVRRDDKGIDFGLWKQTSPADLFIPLDVHTARIARKFGLLSRNQNDWQAVKELTENLREFDPNDPVKYDYALFGLGVNEKSAI